MILAGSSLDSAMACNTFGSTPVASISRTITSSQRLLTLCFAGTIMRLNVMSICQMFWDLSLTWTAN